MKDRRDKKSIDERIKRAERRAQRRAQGIGAELDDDDEDDERAEWEEDDDSGPVRAVVPGDVDWHTFLQWIGWSDEETLNRQSAWWVQRCWRVYLFGLETGVFDKTLI